METGKEKVSFYHFPHSQLATWPDLNLLKSIRHILFTYIESKCAAVATCIDLAGGNLIQTPDQP